MNRREVLFGIGAASLTSIVGCGDQSHLAAPPKTQSPLPTATQVPSPPVGAIALGHFALFGVDERLLREALAAALSRGADHADLFFQHKETNYVSFEDGAVNRAYSGVELGVGVRAVKGDQVGYGYTEDLSLDAVRRAAQTAAAVADGPPRQGPTAFKIGTLPSRYVTKLPWDKVTTKQRVPLVERLGTRGMSADPRVKKVTLSLGDEHGVILIVDSEGRVFEDFQPMTTLGMSIVAEHKGRRESNGYNYAARAGFEFYTEERLDRLVREATDRTTVLFESVKAPAGEMPVVLAPGASGILLHEAIGHGMEADFNRKNTSIYADKVNKRIAKDFVSIVDDGTIEGSRGAIDIDDEGNAPQKTVLVDKGILATYMHDAISAKHYGVKPTGSGRRESYRHVPMPRMRATYMLEGPHGEDEIVKSVKKGILCKTFTNGQVNIGAGDFTFYVKNGYLIEDGKITRPVTDVNLIGNGPKVLELVDMVGPKLAFDEGGWTCGKNGQGVPVSLGMPMCRISSITVGGVKS